MLVNMLKSKIHGGIVTEANVDYQGSLTLDPVLIRESGMLVHEKVLVANFSNGNRFETYIIEGREGSGEICLNGGAALHGRKGDKVMVAAFAQMDIREAETFRPRIIILDTANNISSRK